MPCDLRPYRPRASAPASSESSVCVFLARIRPRPDGSMLESVYCFARDSAVRRNQLGLTPVGLLHFGHFVLRLPWIQSEEPLHSRQVHFLLRWLQSEEPSHCAHSCLSLLCSQMEEPPHSLHLDFCLPCWHNAEIWRFRGRINKSLTKDVDEASAIGWGIPKFVSSPNEVDEESSARVLSGKLIDESLQFPITSSPAGSCSFSFPIPLFDREHERGCLKCRTNV
jgi:hypothetical protein